MAVSGTTYYGKANGIRWECQQYGHRMSLSLWYSAGWTTFLTDHAFPDGSKLMLQRPDGYRTLVPLAGILAKVAGVPISGLREAMEGDHDLRRMRDGIKSALAEREEFTRTWPACLTTLERKDISERVTKGDKQLADAEHPIDFRARYQAEAQSNPWIRICLEQVDKLARKSERPGDGARD